MRNWFKVIVGSLLMLDCSINVVVIGLNESLRGEPVAMFVANLSAADFLFGMFLTLIGLSDIVLGSPVPAPLCLTLQHICLSDAWAIKIARLMVALDMLIAVVRPLHYHQIIDDWMKPMLAAPWLMMSTEILVGVLFSALMPESVYEFGLRQGSLTKVGTDCRWELLPNAWHFFFETGMLVWSTLAGSAFIYASVVGIRYQKVIEDRREEASANNTFFLRRFKSLQKIAKVVFLFIAVDIIAAADRISTRWYYFPLPSSIIHFLRIIGTAAETWVYGMNNVALLNAYKSFFQKHLGFLRRDERVRPEIPAIAAQ